MHGRVGRLEWWTAFVTANIAAAWAGRFLYGSVLSDGQPVASASLEAKVILGLAEATILALVLLVQRDISTRRARDRDVRPIAFWVYAATSVLSGATSFGLSASGGSLPFSPAWIWAPHVVAWVWVALEFGVRPGDPMANRWGPVPKHPFDYASPRSNNYKPPRI